MNLREKRVLLQRIDSCEAARFFREVFDRKEEGEGKNAK